MSVKLQMEVTEELMARVLSRATARDTEGAVLEALEAFSRRIPPEFLRPISERYPSDPDIRSQKDLVKFMGTFDSLASDEEFEAMRDGSDKWPSSS